MKLSTILANKTQLPIAMLLFPMTALVSLTILSGTILASSTVSADDNTSAVDQISITVPVSCTMSGTGMDTHNATINNGTYVSDIGTTTLHAFCNDNEGFAIYAAGYTGDIIGDTNSNKLVGTSASSNTVIDSGLATSAGNPDVSNWAMKLTMTQDSGDTTSTNAFTIDSAPNVDLPSEAESGATQASFSDYHVVPNEYVKVAHKNSMTDMTASTGGVKLTTTYAAYISRTQPADTYSGQVIYTLVHPSNAPEPVPEGKVGVTYHANGSTFAGGAETNRVIYAIEQSGTEPSTEFTAITADKGTYAQTADWYGSWYADINGEHHDFTDESELMTFLSENNSTLSGTNIDLYRGLTFTEAYTRANKTQDGGYYKQQELTKSMCNTIAVTQNQTVKDVRDNTTYMISKLKDGNCWMLDNLALDPTDATTAANMNASNTNATAEAITNYLNGGSSNTGWSNTAVANVTSDFNSYIAPIINNASKDTLVTSYGPASTNGQAKVGIYYNYCAAAVGTYCYASGVDKPDTIIDADQDICPANWRMPTGGSTGEYQSLAGKYTSTTATDSSSLQYNLSTPLSGYFLDSSAHGRGNSGLFWSSTFVLWDYMYSLYLGPTHMNPSLSSGHSNFGSSIRCLVGD